MISRRCAALRLPWMRIVVPDAVLNSIVKKLSGSAPPLAGDVFLAFLTGIIPEQNVPGTIWTNSPGTLAASSCILYFRLAL